MSIPFGNLKLDYAAHKPSIDAAIRNVLERGWFVLGEAGRAFEAAFADYCGIPFAIGVGSGTEALHLALVAIGIQSGDEIITVSNTCVPTLSAISFSGATPILVDIDPQTQTMNPWQIVERLTPRTKAILPVHLYGQCADMDPILEIAGKHGLRVVEDCAQAHGARYKGRMAGSMGDAGCYSFYPSKNLGAYGDAGMIICRDPMLAERLQMIRNYGENQRYHHVVKGFNSRLDELQASILLAKLPALDTANARRRQIASAYTERLSNLDWIVCPKEAPGRQHAYHLYVIRVPNRSAFQRHLADRGVSTLIHYPLPIHRQQSYCECLNQAEFLPITDEQAEEIVSLPIYPELTDEQVERVIEAVESFSDFEHDRIPRHYYSIPQNMVT
jgi:dTDP-4-amino-4,6-dideoxygalactose transaminase